MFINSKDAKSILAKAEEMKTHWNETVSKFVNRDVVRRLTAKWTYVKLDIEDLLMEVRFDTGWDDDDTVCSIDVNVDDVEIQDILNDIESQINTSLKYQVQRDDEYAKLKAKAEESRKRDRLAQYHALKAEFEGK